MMAVNRHKPKAYARSAGKRLGLLISEIKQNLKEDDLKKLRTWYLLVVNYNDENALSQMVKLLNCKKYQTRISFQVLSCYSKEHGHNTLEIKEERF